jgi:hypothetical protein
VTKNKGSHASRFNLPVPFIGQIRTQWPKSQAFNEIKSLMVIVQREGDASHDALRLILAG